MTSIQRLDTVGSIYNEDKVYDDRSDA